MTDPKKLAKLQIDATLFAVLGSTLIALGIAIIVFALTLSDSDVSTNMQYVGVGVVLFSIAILYFLFNLVKKKIDQSDK